MGNALFHLRMILTYAFNFRIIIMTDANNKIRWAPLESNPTVFNEYIAKLGVPNNWVSFTKLKKVLQN